MADFTAEEVQKLKGLLEMEEIRKVRMLYSQLMDSSRIDELADLFTEDGLCEFGPYGQWEGRETIRKNFKEVEGSHHGDTTFFAMHNTCDHWVELTGPDTAVGRSYLIDVVTQTPKEEQPIVWFGLYDEDYAKVDGQWLIKRCSLQFLWPERHLTEGFPGPFPPE